MPQFHTPHRAHAEHQVTMRKRKEFLATRMNAFVDALAGGETTEAGEQIKMHAFQPKFAQHFISPSPYSRIFHPTLPPFELKKHARASACDQWREIGQRRSPVDAVRARPLFGAPAKQRSVLCGHAAQKKTNHAQKIRRHFNTSHPSSLPSPSSSGFFHFSRHPSVRNRAAEGSGPTWTVT